MLSAVTQVHRPRRYRDTALRRGRLPHRSVVRVGRRHPRIRSTPAPHSRWTSAAANAPVPPARFVSSRMSATHLQPRGTGCSPTARIGTSASKRPEVQRLQRRGHRQAASALGRRQVGIRGCWAVHVSSLAGKVFAPGLTPLDGARGGCSARTRRQPATAAMLRALTRSRSRWHRHASTAPPWAAARASRPSVMSSSLKRGHLGFTEIKLGILSPSSPRSSCPRIGRSAVRELFPHRRAFRSRAHAAIGLVHPVVPRQPRRDGRGLRARVPRRRSRRPGAASSHPERSPDHFPRRSPLTADDIPADGSRRRDETGCGPFLEKRPPVVGRRRHVVRVLVADRTKLPCGSPARAARPGIETVAIHSDADVPSARPRADRAGRARPTAAGRKLPRTSPPCSTPPAGRADAVHPGLRLPIRSGPPSPRRARRPA